MSAINFLIWSHCGLCVMRFLPSSLSSPSLPPAWSPSPPGRQDRIPAALALPAGALHRRPHTPTPPPGSQPSPCHHRLEWGRGPELLSILPDPPLPAEHESSFSASPHVGWGNLARQMVPEPTCPSREAGVRRVRPGAFLNHWLLPSPHRKPRGFLPFLFPSFLCLNLDFADCALEQ